jgi:hypothetical protein
MGFFSPGLSPYCWRNPPGQAREAAAKRAVALCHLPYFESRRSTASIGIEKGSLLWLSRQTATEREPTSRDIVCQGKLVAQT